MAVGRHQQAAARAGTRRWLNNFTVTDNVLSSAADYASFSVAAPDDPRLPGGGGYTISFNATSATVNLVQPGQVWGDRVNELDFKVAKILRFGETRTNVGLEIYDALNRSPVLTYNQTYNPVAVGGNPWLQPLSIMTPRFLKFSVQFDF